MAGAPNSSAPRMVRSGWGGNNPRSSLACTSVRSRGRVTQPQPMQPEPQSVCARKPSGISIHGEGLGPRQPHVCTAWLGAFRLAQPLLQQIPPVSALPFVGKHVPDTAWLTESRKANAQAASAQPLIFSIEHAPPLQARQLHLGSSWCLLLRWQTPGACAGTAMGWWLQK